MDIDPMEAIEEHEESRGRSRLNALVAISVALLATFLGVCKVKDDNIVQAMQQAQANKIDYWSWYQARNIREELLAANATQMKTLALAQTTETARRAFLQAAKSFEAASKSQHEKKDKLQKEAQGFDEEYDRLNFRDDQFDLSDASLAIAISLLALTALTQKKWLFWIAMAPTVFGVVMGLAGIFSLKIHPDRLAGWLS